jgi:hypothetical protein
MATLGDLPIGYTGCKLQPQNLIYFAHGNPLSWQWLPPWASMISETSRILPFADFSIISFSNEKHSKTLIGSPVPIITFHSFRSFLPPVPEYLEKVETFKSESLEDFTGIGGNFKSESVETFGRIMQI